MASDDGIQVVATIRAARHNYFIDDRIECGMVLKGSEVKSLRESKVQLTESHAAMNDGEMWIIGLHIAPYSHAQTHTGHEPTRRRKLLLHRRELDRIRLRMQQERLSLVPMRLYFRDGRAKVEIGLGKPKRNVDKRQDIARRDAARDAEREMGRALKGDW